MIYSAVNRINNFVGCIKKKAIAETADSFFIPIRIYLSDWISLG